MGDKIWNDYLKKFDPSFISKIDEDGCRIIEGKFGKIGVYDLKNQLLGVWCINLTPRKKSSLLKHLNSIFIEIHQDCDDEFGAYFHEKDLEKVCKVIKARKRRRLPEKQLEKLSKCVNFLKPNRE